MIDWGTHAETDHQAFIIVYCHAVTIDSTQRIQTSAEADNAVKPPVTRGNHPDRAAVEGIFPQAWITEVFLGKTYDVRL